MNFNESKELFIKVDEMSSLLNAKYNDTRVFELVQKYTDKALINVFVKDEIQYCYVDDYYVCEKLLELNLNLNNKDFEFVGFDGDLFIECIKLSTGTYLRYSAFDSSKKVPAFVKNIIYCFEKMYKKGEERLFDVLGVNITTDNEYIIQYIEDVKKREVIIQQLKTTTFSNSSTYMGSKKSIAGFILEAIQMHCNAGDCFLDIMCGSGAISNTFAQFYPVYSSDAQLFCRLLAKVQGKGFDSGTAKILLGKLKEKYIENYNELQERCKESVILESDIFHSDIRNIEYIFERYADFIEGFKLYSSTDKTLDDIDMLIADRKENNTTFPYCLFTYYYSNVYFGLEQCIQIDSIRYAIDSLKQEEYKDWLLGVLIITVSVVASNYAGHFAQPKRIDIGSIYQIIEQRRQSVWLEFSKRLYSIAEESERYKFEISIIDGPWENALKLVRKAYSGGLVVYVDAPYTREEYSRYYHVLETLARYDYPSSENKGRMRSIKKGERFRSKFSSRTISNIDEYFVHILCTVLSTARVCAWSYSNKGVANMMDIIDSVREITDCKVYIYSIEHHHVSQGKRNPNYKRNVIEYCVVFKKEA